MRGSAIVAALIAVAVALLVGVAVGWALRGHVARWCRFHGETLVCPTCRPLPAVGYARVPMRQPQPSTVDRPLMTRVAENRASRLQRRRAI